MENREKQEQTQELTIRQHKFVRGYLEGKPMVRAATEAAYAPSTAARGAAELMRSPKVRSAIHEALEEARIPVPVCRDAPEIKSQGNFSARLYITYLRLSKFTKYPAFWRL